MSSFLTSIKEAVDVFRSLSNDQPIRIISNKDTDGITAASILVGALHHTQTPTVCTFVKQLTKDYLDTLAQEQYSIYFFLDMGANHLDILSQKLSGKHLFVLDHHYPDSFSSPAADIIHINPHLHNIDGTKEISAASITYLFVKTLDKQHLRFAHLAIVGSIGDMQEHYGFSGINHDILQDAIACKTITVIQDARLFGVHTKPLHKFLMYTTNPYMPGVTGNEKGALQFLASIGITPKHGVTYRTLADLRPKEKERLLAAITVKRSQAQTDDQAIIGPVYLLPEEPVTSPTHDAVEYSTLINACGKMGNPSLGIGVCLGDGKLKEKATLLLHEYHNEIVACLNWFYANKGTEHIIATDHCVIIHAENAIRDGLIGTLVSMISKSNVYPDGTVLVGLASMLSDETKASTRICGFKESPLDLRKIIQAILKKTGGQGGGHRLAAGATIPQGKAPLFITTCTELLDKALLEPSVKTG